ncbi:MAG: aromatic amino acid lyase [Bacteroidetes bacterium]|nr:aromatic amino acid lyase [Bacteroidota bacterium]
MHTASLDSISSCNEQKDYVNMGTNAVTKCLRVAENLEKILAIELLTAAQAYEFRGPAKSSPIIEKLFEDYRKAVTFNEFDRYMHEDISNSIGFIKTLNLDL